MTATAKWSEDQPARAVEPGEIAQLWSEVEAEVVRPVVLVLEMAGAEANAVIGDETGTVLLYFPAGYEQTGTGSLHSVGDRRAAERNEWQPPMTAYYFGHHTEFARWSVVSNEVGRRALVEFCEEPQNPPASIIWDED